MAKRRIYSRELNDVFGIIPKWIIRWGCTIILLIFVGLFIGSYQLKYPQKIVAPISIFTENNVIGSNEYTIGRMNVSSNGYGKVKIGQNVNVKLIGFPFMEYGIIKGRISSLKEARDTSGYMVEIFFPKGLCTTYNKKIEPLKRMDGIGEIIIQDRRLFDYFILPIRSMSNE